jgi:hypothetical protein
LIRGMDTADFKLQQFRIGFENAYYCGNSV